MNTPKEDQANGIAPPSRFKGIFASAAFIVFTLITGLTCIFVLSATLTQARISSLAIEGVA